jgi:lipopolysaccharide export system permease protein
VLAPLLLSAFAISLLSFSFNERVVTRSSATLKAWQDVDYGKVPRDSGVRSNVYLTEGPDILTATSVYGRGKELVMEGVTFYARDPRGMISRQVRSPRATYAAPGWLLETPTLFDVQSAMTTKLKPLVVGKSLTPTQVALSKVDADGENAIELKQSIDLLDAAGRRTAEVKGKWWHKFSGPLSATLMPLLGAVAAFGLARSGQLFIRAIIGMGLGFAYFVVDNAALAMGNFGGYPPLLAAWAPFLLFLLIGETVLVRTEE